MDWNLLKTKAETVNSIVIAAAVGVGGVWAWYTFNGELKRENAASQLEKLKSEIDELNRPAIEVEVVAKPMPPLGTEHHIQVEVILHNKGRGDIEIPIQQRSLRVTPVVTPDLPLQPYLGSNSQFVPQPLMTNVSGEKVGVRSLTMSAGAQNGLLYVVQVDEPGRYLVEFSAQKSSKGGKTMQDVELSASQIVDVPAAGNSMRDGLKSQAGASKPGHPFKGRR